MKFALVSFFKEITCHMSLKHLSLCQEFNFLSTVQLYGISFHVSIPHLSCLSTQQKSSGRKLAALHLVSSASKLSHQPPQQSKALLAYLHSSRVFLLMSNLILSPYPHLKMSSEIKNGGTREVST